MTTSGSLAAVRVARRTAWRNRRRSLFIVVLVVVPVAVAVFAAGALRATSVTGEDRARAEFGAAEVRVRFDTRLATLVEDTLRASDPDATFVRFRSGTTLITPGQVGRVTDVDVEAETLTLTDGRVPAAPGEVALDGDLAHVLGVSIGDDAELHLGGGEPASYTVVGIVREVLTRQLGLVLLDPAGMDALATGSDPGLTVLDEVWLVTTSSTTQPEHVADALTVAWADEAAELDPDAAGLPDLDVAVRELQAADPELADQAPAISTLVAAVLLAEVAFLAGAAFAAGTRRRLREIGLLGANGASTAHVRLTVIGEGLALGLLGGLSGLVLGIGALIASRPVLQAMTSRFVEALPITVADLVGPLVAAVFACVVAAWLPARSASRVPTATALQGRMPVSPPSRRLVPTGIGMAGFGTLLLTVGLASQTGAAAALTLLGVALIVGGVALLTGPLVALVSRAADPLPTVWRLVLRDAGRQRGRVAAGVSAMMVILVAPVAGMIIWQTEHVRSVLDGLPSPPNHVVVTGHEIEPSDGSVTVPGDEEIGRGGAPAVLPDERLTALRAALPGADIARFDVVATELRYPGELEALRPDGTWAWMTTVDTSWWSDRLVAVANDELLRILGDDRLDAALADEGVAILGVEHRRTVVGLGDAEREVTEVPVAVVRQAMPRVLVSGEVAASLSTDRGSHALVVTDEPLTLDVLGQLRTEELRGFDLVADVPGPASIRPELVIPIILLATFLVAVIVVATVTALSGSEVDHDLRTVVAIGAPGVLRRRFLGLQSGVSALLATLLAVPLGLLLMAVGSAAGSDTYVLTFAVVDAARLHVPWRWLAVLLLGLPLLLAGLTALTVRSAPVSPPVRAS